MSDKTTKTPGVAELQFTPVADHRGQLLPIEFADERFPFQPARGFIIADMPLGVSRADHASVNCDEVIVLLAGAVDVAIDDGTERRSYRLDRVGAGLFIRRMQWVSFTASDPRTMLWVLASEPYASTRQIEDPAAFYQQLAGNLE